MKTCSRCKQLKSAEEFYQQPGRKDGMSCQCKNCISYVASKRYYKDLEKSREKDRAKRSEYRKANPEKEKVKQKKWRDANPEKVKENNRRYAEENPEWSRIHALKTKYGLTLAEFRTMVAEQKEQCALCGVAMKVPQVDHDHGTGKVRAVLCASCNTGLGHFKDSPTLLRKAAGYIEKFSEQSRAEVKQ